jgi:hypothetical protein
MLPAVLSRDVADPADVLVTRERGRPGGGKPNDLKISVRSPWLRACPLCEGPAGEGDCGASGYGKLGKL